MRASWERPERRPGQRIPAKPGPRAAPDKPPPLAHRSPAADWLALDHRSHDVSRTLRVGIRRQTGGTANVTRHTDLRRAMARRALAGAAPRRHRKGPNRSRADGGVPDRVHLLPALA